MRTSEDGSQVLRVLTVGKAGLEGWTLPGTTDPEAAANPDTTPKDVRCLVRVSLQAMGEACKSEGDLR